MRNSKGNAKGWAINEPGPLSLTPSELQAVYRLTKKQEETLNEGDYGGGYDEYDGQIDEEHIRSILKKVSDCLPKEAKEEIDKEFLREKYHSYNNNIDQGVYATLKKAFELSRSVEIKYFNMESAEFRKRKLDVYYTSAKYTIGYCHLRKEIRKFRTSRIASAKLTNSRYTVSRGFDKNDY